MTSPTMRTVSRLALGAALLLSAGCSTLQGLIPGREAATPVIVPAPQVAIQELERGMENIGKLFFFSN